MVFNEVEYGKLVTDIINQNVKDDFAKIKNYCNIKTSINNEKFKLNLSEIITDDMIIFSELEKCIF